MHPLLTPLLSEEFEQDVGLWLPPAAMRMALSRRREAAQLAEALRVGALNESILESCIREVSRRLVHEREGHLEMFLALLAVVMENRATRFAADYLERLSSLNRAEVYRASLVASECRPHQIRNFYAPDDEQDVVLPAIRTFPMTPMRSTMTTTHSNTQSPARGKSMIGTETARGAA